MAEETETTMKKTEEAEENINIEETAPENTETKIPEDAAKEIAEAGSPEDTVKENTETDTEEKTAEETAENPNHTPESAKQEPAEPITPDKESKDQENNQQKPRKGKKPLLCFAGGVFILVLIYILIGLSYQNKFFPGTSINGINVSGMTAAQAEAAINADMDNYILTVEELGGETELIRGDAIGIRAEYNGGPASLLAHQNILLWGMGLFTGNDYSIETMITCDEEKLADAIMELACMDKNNWTDPVNAYFEYDEQEGYRIVPERPGTEIQTDVFLQAASNAVCSLTKNLSLEDSKIYKQAAFSSDAPKVQEQLAFLQSLNDMTITYLFDDEKEVLDIHTFRDWISVDSRGKLAVDEEPVRKYVKELEKKYNTAYSPKTLKTTYGPEVTIARGHYGWMIDRDGEVEALTKLILEGKSVEREPVYSQRASSHSFPDYGNSYVEINLTAQHLFLYIDGELVTESDFVSGNPSKGNYTPDGAYPITYKQRNAVLRGQGYASPVSYWMPFNGNIGMHDSSWRSTYGGLIYQTNGSHGCINLPRDAAKTIFENIDTGFPVLCYFLPGTENVANAAPPIPGTETEPVIPVPNPETPVPEMPIPAQETPAPEIPLPAQETPAPEIPLPVPEAPIIG